MSRTRTAAARAEFLSKFPDEAAKSDHFAELGRRSAAARRGGLVLTREEVEAAREVIDQLAGDPRWQRIWRRLLSPVDEGDADASQ